jgi:MYXO-CTERM domain-containing protein
VNEQLTDLTLRVLAAVLIVLGLGCVLLGYLGVRRSDDIVLQLPYLASGGVGGLALLALGALALVQQQMREQSRRAAQVTESLEEWKEAALAEIRAFLEGATVEVQVLAPVAPAAESVGPPATVTTPRQRRASTTHVTRAVADA